MISLFQCQLGTHQIDLHTAGFGGSCLAGGMTSLHGVEGALCQFEALLGEAAFVLHTHQRQITSRDLNQEIEPLRILLMA